MNYAFGVSVKTLPYTLAFLSNAIAPWVSQGVFLCLLLSGQKSGCSPASAAPIDPSSPRCAFTRKAKAPAAPSAPSPRSPDAASVRPAAAWALSSQLDLHPVRLTYGCKPSASRRCQSVSWSYRLSCNSDSRSLCCPSAHNAHRSQRSANNAALPHGPWMVLLVMGFGNLQQGNRPAVLVL